MSAAVLWNKSSSLLVFVALRLPARKSEIKKLWWCPLERVEEYVKLVYPKYYFQKKKNPILRFWIIFCFGPNFVFGGTPLGHFSKYYFLFFIVDQPWWPTFLLSSLLPYTHPHPYHKKSSYSPDIMSNLILSSHKKVFQAINMGR